MSAQLRLLLVEDSEDDALLILEELRMGGYEPQYRRVQTSSAMIAALEEQTWDAVISDHVMPGFSGPAALKLIQERGLDLPFIIVSGKLGEEAAVEAMKGGAHDYVSKDNLTRLVPAIKRELREAEVRREARRAGEALLVEKQRLDDLTEYSNCGLFLLDEEVKVTYANRLAQEWFGPFEELKGKYCYDLFQLKDPERECAGLRVVKTGKPVSSDGFVKVVGGQNKFLYVSATPVKDKTGKVRQVTEVVIDITERKRAEELSDALNTINAAISSTLDLGQIMQGVVVEAAKAVGSETAAVVMREHGQWVVRYLHGHLLERAPHLLGMRFSDEEFRVAVLAAETGAPVVIGDASRDERVKPELARRFGLRSLLAVPLQTRKGVIGALYFAYHSAPVAFTRAEIDFAGKLAVSISLAIDNARLYEAQRNIAETLQEALLTVPQTIEGLEFGHLYRSATEAARVGGDFYDLFELEHGNVGIIVGDVSGKGVEAATLASVVRHSIKAYSYQESSPASILAKTSELVAKTTLPSSFVTVFFGVLDTRSGLLTYCNAGHPPAVLRSRNSKLSLLETDSPALGPLTWGFSDAQIVLEPGDVLFAYTDGLTEARRDHELFGEERLMRLVEKAGDRPVKELPQLVLEKVMEFSSGKLADDVALLALSLGSGL